MTAPRARARLSHGALAFVFLLAACTGVLRPSQHDVGEYSNVVAAVSAGDLAFVKRAINDNPALVTQTEWQEQTLLHDAVDKDQYNVAVYLISKHADVNAKAEDGRTPLHFAAQHGSVKLIELLLDNDAQINAVDRNGWTPLYRAIRWQHVDAAAFLRSKGARS